MDYQLVIQSTPNPNARKFVLNVPVKTEGNITYKDASEAQDNPLAGAIFQIDPAIQEVFFFDNYITVTQNGTAGWPALEETIKIAILDGIKDHDPNFKSPVAKDASEESKPESPELKSIEEILDQTIRPALQMDGGDLKCLGYNNNILKITYKGACCGCPSASMGTLMAVENILRDRFNPNLKVELAGMV